MSLAIKEVKAKWEDEVRAQLQENVREIHELEKWFEERRRKANNNNGSIGSIETVNTVNKSVPLKVVTTTLP